MTALQCITSSSVGPSSRSASFGSDWYVWSSVMRRFVGVALREEPAMLADLAARFNWDLHKDQEGCNMLRCNVNRIVIVIVIVLRRLGSTSARIDGGRTSAWRSGRNLHRAWAPPKLLESHLRMLTISSPTAKDRRTCKPHFPPWSPQKSHSRISIAQMARQHTHTTAIPSSARLTGLSRRRGEMRSPRKR